MATCTILLAWPGILKIPPSLVLLSAFTSALSPHSKPKSHLLVSLDALPGADVLQAQHQPLLSRRPEVQNLGSGPQRPERRRV